MLLSQIYPPSGYRNCTFKPQTVSENPLGHNRTMPLYQFSDCNLVFNRSFFKLIFPFISKVPLPYAEEIIQLVEGTSAVFKHCAVNKTETNR